MTTEEKIKVMQAYLDDKQIEIQSKHNIKHWYDWSSCVEPEWNWAKYQFRIKE